MSAWLLDTAVLVALFRQEPGAERTLAILDDEEASAYLAAPSAPELAIRIKGI